MNVNIKLLENGKLPEFKHTGDACMDAYANLGNEVLTIHSGKRHLIPLGFAVQLPEGYELVVRPRSGLSKLGIDNCIGTVDSGYTGEVKTCLINNSNAPFIVRDKDRICQIAIRKTESVDWNVVDELSETERGSDGFGSTGLQ